MDALKQAIIDNQFYDYIANNYTLMSKDTLKDIILECLGAYSDNHDNNAYFQYTIKVMKGLVDRGAFDGN